MLKINIFDVAPRQVSTFSTLNNWERMKYAYFALQNAWNNDQWSPVVKNIRDNHFWCCVTSSINIFYVDKLGTYEMCIFCVKECTK